MRFAVKKPLLAVVSIVLLVTTLVVENVHAGPDIVTSPRLSLWVDIARVGVRTKLGPFDLAAPRLVDGRCSADGRRAVLTFASPITAARTLVLVEFLRDQPRVGSEPRRDLRG